MVKQSPKQSIGYKLLTHTCARQPSGRLTPYMASVMVQGHQEHRAQAASSWYSHIRAYCSRLGSSLA